MTNTKRNGIILKPELKESEVGMPGPIAEQFNSAMLESLAKELGECGTGNQITNAFREIRMVESGNESTKWRRLNATFVASQQRTGSSKEILDFIKVFLSKERFARAGGAEEFNGHRGRLNQCLLLAGIEYGEDGEFRQVKKAQTLTEAERRVNNLSSRLAHRRIHSEVLKYCNAELLQDNYFHAVFEACKGLSQRIRDASESQQDGARLIQDVFTPKAENNGFPIIMFNGFQTETEKSEHFGLTHLLNGIVSAFRNPTAHTPKVLWQDDEHDAADCLSLISFLHYRLDKSVYPKSRV